jgi:hypothetical protein
VRGCSGTEGWDVAIDADNDDEEDEEDDDDEGAVLAPSCAAARRCAIAGGGAARAAAFCRKEEEEEAWGREELIFLICGRMSLCRPLPRNAALNLKGEGDTVAGRAAQYASSETKFAIARKPGKEMSALETKRFELITLLSRFHVAKFASWGGGNSLQRRGSTLF